MIRRLLCVLWILPFLIDRAACQQCLICGPQQEGGSCRPNKLMEVPENITISDRMCTAIEETGYHKDVLCEEYKAPKGYVFECLDSSNSQFSCRSTCGPSLDSIGTGPEFDLLNQNGGLLLGKGANKRGGLLDFPNFQNGGGFDFGLGDVGRNSFGQNNNNPNVKAQTNTGSGATASGSTANKENNQKLSSSVGNGDQDLFNKDLFGDLGFNSIFPNGKNTNPINNSGKASNPGATPLKNSPVGQSDSEPLKISLHRERDTDSLVVPVNAQIKPTKPGNPEKAKLVKIPNIDLKVNPSNLVIVEPADRTVPRGKIDTPPVIFSPQNKGTKNTSTAVKYPSTAVNDPYGRYAQPKSNQPQPPPESRRRPQGIAIGEPNNSGRKPDNLAPKPSNPDNSDGRNFARKPPPLPPQQDIKPIEKPRDDPHAKPSFSPPSYPPPPRPSSQDLPTRNYNNPPSQYPKRDPGPRQPPRELSPYPNPASNSNSPNPATDRNSGVRVSASRAPPPKIDGNPYRNNPSNNYNKKPPGQFSGDPPSPYANPRQPNTQRQTPYENNGRDSGKNQYDDRYPKPPQYSDSNSNDGRRNGGNGGGGGGENRVKPPAGLDGSRLKGNDGNVNFDGTSLLADSDYLDKPSQEGRFKGKVPDEFEKPFKAENNIFPGFSNFANGDGNDSGFGTGKSIFNLFDDKDKDPSGFNFNNKDFLKPDGGNNKARNDNSNNAPTSSPSRYGQGPPQSPQSPPRNSFNSRPPSNSQNRIPDSFRPAFQPQQQQQTQQPQQRPNNIGGSGYPNNNGRNDLIRQNERRNPSQIDPFSSPTSNRPFITAPNQNNPSSNNQRSPFPQQPPSQQNNYNPNNIYNSPRQNEQPRNQPQANRFSQPQQKEDNSPPFNTNLRSPLNLFGESLPFSGNSNTRPSPPTQNSNSPPSNYNPQTAPPNQNFPGNPYQSPDQHSRNPSYPPSSNPGFQGLNPFSQPSSGNPQDNQRSPFQQQSQQPPQSQPARRPFDFQGPDQSFQPGFRDNNNNNNFAPNPQNPTGVNRFSPPYQPRHSNDSPFARGDRTVPSIHVNNFLNNRPTNQHNNPQSGPGSNNRPPFAPRNPNQAPSFPTNNNRPPTNNRGSQNTPYDIQSPQQPSRPSFELDIKPLNQPSNSRPDSFFGSSPQNPRTFDTRPPSQQSTQQPSYSGPPNNRGSNPFSFGNTDQSRAAQPSSYQPSRPAENGNRNPFSFDSSPRGTPPRSTFDQRRPTNNGIGDPFSFSGPARGPQNQPPRPTNDRTVDNFNTYNPPTRGTPSQNQPRPNGILNGGPFSFDAPARNPSSQGPPRPGPASNDRFGGGNPFSFGNREPPQNNPPPSYGPPRPSSNDRTGDPFSFGGASRPSSPFDQRRPSPNRNDNNPFSINNRGGSRSSIDQSPPPRANINTPPNYPTPGNRFDSPYNSNPNQRIPPNPPFQQGAAPARPQQSGPPRGDNSPLTHTALLDSSPFSFEDPTGSDQSIPSFGADKSPPQQRQDLRPTNFGGGLSSYVPPSQGGRPPFANGGAPGGPGPYPQPGPSNIQYAPPPGRSNYNAPPQHASGRNDPFSKGNPNDFGFDNNFGEFDDANNAFQDKFSSDRFSDPGGYFGDAAFTDDTTQEETNQTSNNKSDDTVNV